VTETCISHFDLPKDICALFSEKGQKRDKNGRVMVNILSILQKLTLLMKIDSEKVNYSAFS
jgi:hypothetical protein